MNPKTLEMTPQALRARRSAKWRDYDSQVLPAWIAEMDYAAVPAVQTAMQELVDRQDYGYARRNAGQPAAFLVEAFARRMSALYGWDIDPAHVLPVADLAQAKAACLAAFSEEGDSVLVQTPCYPPFRDVVRELGRRFVDYPWGIDASCSAFDPRQLDERVRADSRLILLCHPHNPTGRVLEQDELLAIGRIAHERDLIVVSDEVHAELVYPGHAHRPYAAQAQCAERAITITSAAKTFNIPGLRCGLMHFGSAGLLERFLRRVPRRLLGQPNIAGIDATVAAWEHGGEWLAAVREHLAEGRQWLVDAVASTEGIRWHAPQATYFGWIDFSQSLGGRNAARFFLEHARVAFSAGETFAPDCGSFIRFNFATSSSIRQQIWARVEHSLMRNQR